MSDPGSLPSAPTATTVTTPRGSGDVIEQLRGGVIASCQAGPDSPLNSPEMIAALAASTERGGAVGFRVDRPENVAVVRARSRLPIIGVNKQQQHGFDVFITPTLATAREIAAAGADMIALDGTARPRPGHEVLADLIAAIHSELGLPVMADISTYDEGAAAAAAGADVLATTLAGYTPYSHKQPGPALELAAALTNGLPGTPVIVEGRIWTTEDIEDCFARGVHAVVVGSAITVPEFITRRLVAAIPAPPSGEQTASSPANGTARPTPAARHTESVQASASDRFFEELTARLQVLRHDEAQPLRRAAESVAAAIAAGKRIALYDTGHLVSHELVARTGGFVALTRVELPAAGNDTGDGTTRLDQGLDAGEVEQGSVLVIGSVSGTGRDTIELAQRARARGATVIALTAPRHSGRLPPGHPSGRRLMDVADIVLDNHADYGDAFLTVAPLDRAIVPFSGFGAVTLAWAVIAAATDQLLARGISPSVYRSIHLPDGEADVAQIENRYARERH